MRGEERARSREAGGFPLGELKVGGSVLLVIYIVVVIVVLNARSIGAETPECLSRIEGLAARLEEGALPEGEGAAPWKAVDLSALLPGGSGEEITCPEVGEVYACSVRGAEWRICCPDPGNHLGIGDDRSCRVGGGWDLPAAEESDIEDPLWWSSVGENGGLILSRRRGWPVCGVYGVFVWAILYSLIFPWFLVRAHPNSKGKPRWRLVLDYIAYVLIFLAIWTVILVPAGLPWFYTPRFSFAPGGGMEAAGVAGPVTLWRESAHGGSILAVGRSADPPSVLIHHRGDQGEVRTWRLRPGEEENVDRLASMIRGKVLGQEGLGAGGDPVERRDRDSEHPAEGR